MKCLNVYRTDNGWFAEEINWKRSGSGFYRETAAIGIPQTREEIEAFLKENGYNAEWRDLASTPSPTANSPAGAVAS